VEYGQKLGRRAGIRRASFAELAGGVRNGMIGLPSLRSLDGAPEMRIWLAVEVTDMRCGFDRLAERVRLVVGQNPLNGHLYVFRSRRGDRLKILSWDRDGYVLWYKRLESGVFKLPRVEQGARSVELRASELAMILDGIDVSKLKRVPRYERVV
jgi:transposase